MNVTEKFLKANRKKLKEINNEGLNRHFGKDNPRWNDGVCLRGNYPCPQCGRDRICVKGDSFRICKECNYSRPKNFNRTFWVKNLRTKLKQFSFEYLGGVCKRCGSGDLPLCCYQFHHRNPKEKEINISELFYVKNHKKMKKELDKCDLLCANCHMIIHWHEEDARTSQSYS